MRLFLYLFLFKKSIVIPHCSVTEFIPETMPSSLSILEDYNHDQLLMVTFILQAAFIFSYLITSFVLIGNTYAGFNGLLLGFIYAAVCGASYYALCKEANRLYYGVILGCCFMLVFMSLQSAIFWGQYSGCHQIEADNRRILSTSVNCEHRTAMGSMCAFSVLMFLSYLFQIVVMIKFKNEILVNAPNTNNAGKGAYSSVPTIPTPYNPNLVHGGFPTAPGMATNK